MFIYIFDMKTVHIFTHIFRYTGELSYVRHSEEGMLRDRNNTVEVNKRNNNKVNKRLQS